MKRTRQKPHPDLKKGGPRRRGFVVTDARGEQTVLPASVALASTVPTTRQVNSGAGLTGGGALSADLTLDVGAGDAINVAANAVNVNVDGVTIHVNGSNELEVLGAGSAWIPLVDGAEPPTFITDGFGVLILVHVDV